MSTDVTRTSPPDGDTTRTQGEPTTRTADLPKDESTLVPHTPTAAGAVDAPPGFALEKEIGIGGMGVVYLARQLGLNRPVALKVVKGSEKVDAKALIRFLAEAEAVASIRHPNVVEVYQYGDHQGRPYMALEYCPGGDLTTLSKAEQTRDAAWFRRVADLMAKVADGVNAAHAQGIVHRDLKPHNVFLTADGTPKVADYGLAKRGLGSDLTNTDAVMGTPAYMAPEQAGGGTKFVGPEADVWALGVMLYELSCGERPIDTSGPVMVAIARVVHGSVSQLRTRVPAVPSDLALIAHKCLSKDPRDRYPTAGGLANDLRNWLDGKPISARPAGVVEQAVKWAKRNKKLAGMGLAVLLTMAVATAVSVGFGLEANRQAGEANRQRLKAEDKSGQLTTALNDVEKSNERTQRTLAKALLGPMSGAARSSPLSEYEQDAVWQLASLRDVPVALMCLEEAAGSPLAAAQLRCRADYLLHAAIGLDARRGTQADRILLARLRDPTASIEQKGNVALAVVVVEQSGADSTVTTDALLAALGRATDSSERQQLTTGLVAVAAKLPAEKAADLLLTALGTAKDGTERGLLAAGLVAVAGRLSADNAMQAYGSATDLLVTALTSTKDGAEREALAVGLVAVTGRLPADRAAQVLLATLGTASDYREREALDEGLAAAAGRLPADTAAEVLLAALTATKSWDVLQPKALAEGLVIAAGRLPPDKAANLLLTALMSTKNWNVQGTTAKELAAVSDRLPAETAILSCGKAAEMLLSALGSTQTGLGEWNLALGLAAVSDRLPAESAVAVCGKAADKLAALLGKEFESGGRWQLARGLVAVAKRLPADREADVLLATFGTAKEASERGQLAEGLAEAAGRLPAEKGRELCGKVVGVLTTALGKAKDEEERRTTAASLSYVVGQLPAESAADVLLAALSTARFGSERYWLASGLVDVSDRLPAAKVSGVYDKAVDGLLVALGTTSDASERQETAERLVAVAGRMPATKAAEVCGKGADGLLTALSSAKDVKERRDLAHGLAEVVKRLPAEQVSEVCGKATDILLAALGTANNVNERREYELRSWPVPGGLGKSELCPHCPDASRFRSELARWGQLRNS